VDANWVLVVGVVSCPVLFLVALAVTIAVSISGRKIEELEGRVRFLSEQVSKLQGLGGRVPGPKGESKCSNT
jgi:hypothetical protein